MTQTYQFLWAWQVKGGLGFKPAPGLTGIESFFALTKEGPPIHADLVVALSPMAEDASAYGAPIEPDVFVPYLAEYIGGFVYCIVRKGQWRDGHRVAVKAS